MNSNYQLNQFYAKDKMANHLKAAQAHRQASQAVDRNKSPQVNNRIDRYVGNFVASLGKVFRRLGQDRVATPTLDMTKS